MKPRRLAVGLSALAGLAAIGLLPGVGPMAIGGALLCLASPWLASPVAAVPWPVLTVAALAGLMAWAGRGATPHEVLGAGLVYLQVHRQLGRSGPADDRISLLLAGLMLAASASAVDGVGWLLSFTAWTAALPVALAPIELPVRSRGALRVVAGAVVGVGVVVVGLFPALPRLRGLEDVGTRAMTGFAPQVELGALDVLLDDPQPVFTVAAQPPFPEGAPIYFRGAALDAFDGRVWSSGGPGDLTLTQAPSSWPATASVLRFTGIPAEGVVFTAGRVRDATVEGRGVRRDRHGALRLDRSVEGPISWLVVADGPWGPGVTVEADPPTPGAYLQLPADLDPRVAALARTITAGEADPKRAADRIADHLRQNATYTRAPGDAGTDAPLTSFLLDRREGHCEYFASAQAVLMRTLGHPSRVVNGFVSTEADSSGSGRVVRRYHAHAWAEVWVPRRGWVIVDATPGPGAPTARQGLAALGLRLTAWWQRAVLDYDRERQRRFVWSAGAAVEEAAHLPARSTVPWRGLALLVVGCLAVGWVVERVVKRVGARWVGDRDEASWGPVERAWASARAAVEALGPVAPPSLPPLSAARFLGERHAAVAEPLQELAWLVYRVRHAGEDATDHAQRARDLSRDVVRRARDLEVGR